MSNVGGITAGLARHNSSNIGGVTAGHVGHNYSPLGRILWAPVRLAVVRWVNRSLSRGPDVWTSLFVSLSLQ